MLDSTKQYQTRAGKRVINIEYIPLNSCGEKVTYPIKGTIVLKEKPFKTEYCIWSEDGQFDVVWNNHSEKDLIEIPQTEEGKE